MCLTASSHSGLTAVSFFIPLSFRLHSESGFAHSAPTASGAALLVCAHCSAAVRRSPDLKVRVLDLNIERLTEKLPSTITTPLSKKDSVLDGQ